MSIRKTILILLGILLFADGIGIAIVSNFNVGVLLTVGLGILLGLWGIFFEQIRAKAKRGLWRAAEIVVCALLAAAVAFCAFLAVYGNTDNVTYDEDAVIVLGCAVSGDRPTRPLVRRLDAAIKYTEKNPDALIVVSGGKGTEERISEAAVMSEYLIAHGVSGEKIILEDKSTSTSENFKFSKELLDSRFGADYSVAAITNDFHIFRAERLAKPAGIEAAMFHAPTSASAIPPSYLREILAVFKMWILGY